MIKQQSGFTLIELIMVIVVLGALAVSALPRYVDLQGQADQGATEGYAGALAAGAAINFADCLADVASGTCLNSNAGGVANAEYDNCDDVGGTVLGGLPATHTITAAALTIANIGDVTTCTVTGPSTSSATFQVLATP